MKFSFFEGDRTMREQPAQITEVIVGPTEMFVSAWCKLPQHDSHCHGWLWNRYLQDAKLRAAAVREEGLRIIARRRALDEQNEITQLAAE
jgi:hypothetical protein